MFIQLPFNFHCQSSATDLMNEFWHTWVRSVVGFVYQQVIYKEQVCQCVRMTQCVLASIELELLLTLFPCGILSTGSL